MESCLTKEQKDIIEAIRKVTKEKLPDSAFSEALFSIIVDEIAKGGLLSLIESHPEFNPKVISVCLGKLMEILSILYEFGEMNMERRICLALVRFGESLGKIDGDIKNICVPIGQEDLSRIIGCRNDVFCRAMFKLEKKGIIESVKGQILILDVDRLIERSSYSKDRKQNSKL